MMNTLAYAILVILGLGFFFPFFLMDKVVILLEL